MNTYLKSILLLLLCLTISVEAHTSTIIPTVFSKALVGHNVNLRAGTLVTLETTTRLSSDAATIGTIVPFRVMTDVVVNGRIVIRNGTQAIGRISGIQAGTYNDPQLIQIEVKFVQAVDGQQINLSSNPIDIEAAMPNEGVCIQIGTMITAHTMNDVVVRVH